MKLLVFAACGLLSWAILALLAFAAYRLAAAL